MLLCRYNPGHTHHHYVHRLFQSVRVYKNQDYMIMMSSLCVLLKLLLPLYITIPTHAGYAYSSQCNIYQIRYYWPPCLIGIELVIHCHCLPSKCLLHSKHHSKTTLLQSCELGSYLVVHISLSSWRHMSSKRLLKIYDWLIVHTTNVIYTLLVWLTHSK